MNKYLLGILISMLVSLPSFAIITDIGDNSILKCDLDVNEKKSICKGQVLLVSDHEGNLKGDVPVTYKESKVIVETAIDYFTQKADEAFDNGDMDLYEEYSKMRSNILFGDYYAKQCFKFKENNCTEGKERFVNACNIANDPENSASDLPKSRGGRSKRNERILKGTSCANSVKSPVVSLYDPEVHYKSFCSGTLISDSVVLTAAHCIDSFVSNCSEENANPEYVVRTQGGVEKSVRGCVMHPNFNGIFDLNNDVGLVFLDEPFSEEEANISNINIDVSKIQKGKNVVVTGYGQNELEDKRLRATINTISKIKDDFINITHISKDSSEGSACFGDSGGSLLSFIDGEWKLIGVTSHVKPWCAIPKHTNQAVNGFTNLTNPSNYNFIKDNTEGILD